MNRKYLTKKILAAATVTVMMFGTVPCQSVWAEEAPEIDGLTFESEMPLEYAQKFKIYNYSDDYRLLDINDGTQYLVVPEGKEAPENLDSDITVLQMPLDRVYLTATSVMSLYDSLDAIDQIRLSGTQANGWYIDDAVSAMEAGDILFAGKYNEPDYELLISEDCDLTIESTMIFHSPKVKEMIEDLGIPVLVEYATYEPHPLGRVEWIKLYGVLTGKEQEAEERFEEQKEIVDEMGNYPNTGKTVAYFYVSSDGKVVVRDSSDYIARMIEIAGGQYIYTNLINEESSLSSVSMTLEEFYNNAIDADYLVYNATIDSPISSIDDLLAKSELFADFKAVKEGNVWCNDKKMYQSVDRIGDAIRDFHLILTDGDESQMTFMNKVN
ncbi:ABC transporter substrate-binding protein [Blautia sp. HCP3S3_G3]|uniref:ABC transporter substrate-binding protein n=1 Tax=Blautia sp. HCP3S3_G3 TaxID=3438913 RepID=UPI003F8912C4